MSRVMPSRRLWERAQSFVHLTRCIGPSAAISFSRNSRRALNGDPNPYPLHPKQLLHPILVRPNTSDIDVFCQIFIEREYLCLHDLEKVDLIIDCGANVGYSSAYFLSQFPRAKAIAVEADEDNYKAACKNLEPYGERASVIHAGVWSRRTGLELRSEPYRDARQSSRQVKESELGKPGSIEGVDIPYLMETVGAKRISLLKIDIEGAEAEVFSEQSRSGDWLPIVDALAIELHDDSAFGPCSEIFQHAIRDQNFKLSKSGELTICVR